MDLSAIIVNYYSRDDLKGCLDSLFIAAGDLSMEAIVVNNSPEERLDDILKIDQDGVKLIENKTNEGYARALNCGLENSGGRNILFLNSDVVLMPGSVREMARFLDLNFKNGRMAAVAPKLLNPDGSLQYSKGNFPTLLSTIKDQFLPRRMRKYSIARYYEPGRVDWVTGCCLMVRREAINRIGPLDENFFMHYEDVDLCFRLNKASFKVFYHPEAEAIHKNPHASRPKGLNGRLEVEIRRSHLYFFRKNYGRWHYRMLYLCTLALACFRYILGRLRALLSPNKGSTEPQVDLMILQMLGSIRF